ncbi:MAG: hypothetical protein LAP38_19900 [Acidobacteriia bacterium]|nr:hypothetical protein [Terriglobia bacterium]
MRLGLAWLLAIAAALAADKGARVVESVLPSLAYGPACWSSVDLQNLGDRLVTVELESHRASGALVAVVDHPQMTIPLAPGERSSFRLEIEEETGSAWMKIRERIPSPQLTPVVAVSGHTECVAENQLRTTAREVAYPFRNPSFSSDVDAMPGYVISLVNTTEHSARARLCYSAGNLYSLPSQARADPAELTPLCSIAFEVQVPPFGARQFPVEREGSSHFSIKTLGEAIVLQMLRPLETGVKIYSVDSSIKFGGEVPATK